VDVKSPEFDGFWIENLGQRVRTREKRRVINGRQYNVRPVQLLSVFALREGKVEIEPLELAVESSGRNSMRRSRKLVSTKAFELDVQPLPPGAPAGFHTSNVGQYSFEVATDKIKVAVGEPLLVSLIANGTGMVGRLKLPRIPAGEGYELLEPVERKKAEMVGRLVGGQKMAEVVLTPTKGGVLTIPELTLHTFDPQRGEYVSLTSKKMMVAVAGRVSKPLKKEEDVVERDASKPDALRLAQMPLRPVRPLGVRTESRSGLLGDPLFLLGLAAPPTLYLLWIGVGAWRRRRDEAAPAQHRRAAPKRASAQLGSAQGLAKKGEEAEACGLVASAMADFLSSMLEIPVGGVSEAKVRRLLEERGVAEALVAEFCVLWGVCSQARFSGEVSPPAEQVVDRARALIKALEDIG
jgi:hypothetical protein